jgi:hypothetical protein
MATGRHPSVTARPTPLHGQGHPLPVGELDVPKICRTSKTTVNFLFTYHRRTKSWPHAGGAVPGVNFKATPFMQ